MVTFQIVSCLAANCLSLSHAPPRRCLPLSLSLCCFAPGPPFHKLWCPFRAPVMWKVSQGRQPWGKACTDPASKVLKKFSIFPRRNAVGIWHKQSSPAVWMGWWEEDTLIILSINRHSIARSRCSKPIYQIAKEVSCGLWWRSEPVDEVFNFFILSSWQTSMYTVKLDLPRDNFTGLCLFSAVLQRQMRLSSLCLGSPWHFGLHLHLGSFCSLCSIHFSVHSLQYFPETIITLASSWTSIIVFTTEGLMLLPWQWVWRWCWTMSFFAAQRVLGGVSWTMIWT